MEGGFPYKWDKLHTDFNGLNNFYSIKEHLREKEVNVSNIILTVP